MTRRLCLLLTSAMLATAHAELNLVARGPVGNNTCIDTPLKLTFNELPVLAHHGKIEVRRVPDGATVETVDLAAIKYTDRFGDSASSAALCYEPVWFDGRTAFVRLRTKCLRPNESYEVRISPGAFQDADGHDFAGVNTGWTFRTKATPSPKADRLIVATDGTGDFCTVQGAVDHVEPGRTPVPVIFVRKGNYHELIRVDRERKHIHLLGENRQSTRINYTNNEKLNSGWIQRAVLGCEADDFLLENLTVQNTTPYRGSQAEAVCINAERCILRNANFLSFQDTLNLSGRIYIANCNIEGDVDYAWGYGTAFFERCELRSMHDGYIVQARNSATRPGYVFLNCRLTAAPGVRKCWLARIDTSRFPASQVAFVHCAMGSHILPEGWQIMGPSTDTLRFEEGGSTDSGGQPLDVSTRNPAARAIAPKQESSFTAESVLSGPDGWHPQ